MPSQSKKPIAAAVGTAFLASVALSPLAAATENPFQLNPLEAGYSLAEKAEAEGKCGEGKCGEEGKCGGKAATKESGEAKQAEGKCGAGKGAAEGKCGAQQATESKAGEGKCGASQ